MDIDLKELEKYWKKFKLEGIVDANVDKDIGEAWIRCRKAGISMKNVTGTKLEFCEFETIKEKNNELIEISKPIMQEIYCSLENSDSTIFITDAKGTILENYRDETAINPLKDANLLPGYRWNEEENGVTSMSLTLFFNKPVQIIGAQHYAKNQHIAAGSAAPIHDEKGRSIGGLNLITFASKNTKHSLGVVAAGAVLIEKQMELLRTLDLFKNTFNEMSDGMILLNENFEIQEMNREGLKLLGLKKENYKFKDIFEYLRKNYFISENMGKSIDLDFKIKEKAHHCIGTINAIKFEGEISNYMIIFREVNSINKLVNRMSGNQAMFTFENIITQDSRMKELIVYGEKIANIDCTLLITGQSGTGKELFAQAIHNAGNRKKGPFIGINCGALPTELIESELFGYETGAFTGAKQGGHPGKFELANGGTLFLDEIGELPLNLQSKMLRVLDSHCITRLGGKEEKQIDVKIITATNRNLEEEIVKKNFRLDLFYRINMITLTLPTLNERQGDIPLLVNYFIKDFNQKNNQHIEPIKTEILEYLKNVYWEGNVRQLQNTVLRACYLAEGEKLQLNHFPDNLIKGNKEEKESKPIPEISMNRVKNFEKDLIREVLEKHQGNVTKAATELNMAKTTLYRKMKKYDILIQRTIQ